MLILIFSAEKIILSTTLSLSDWAHLSIIMKKVGATRLEINKEVDWKELETLLLELPEIRELSFSDIQWNKIADLLKNVNKQLEVNLNSEVIETMTWDNIKRLATLCKDVNVDTLTLSEGRCEGGVAISTNEIAMTFLHLKSGADVTRLHQLVSQSWTVWWSLHLTELRSDDWALLAQLLPTLTRVGWRVGITSNSTSHPAQETLRQLWDKTEIWWTGGGWRVNNEEYGKSNDENFYKIFNKHFQ